MERKQMIDANFLKDLIGDACDLDGSDEAMRWKDWIINTIDVAIKIESKYDVVNKCIE